MKIGIDLGTTFSVASYIDESGDAKIVTNSEGNRTTPSVIFLDEDEVIVGQPAKDEKGFTPEAVFDLVKRSMGKKTTFDYNGKEYSPEHLSSFILKKLIKDTEKVTNQKVEGAVITVPAYFNDAERQATIDAGRIAGIDVLAVINEPTAAGIAYGTAEAGENKKERVLIYDFGGGTFDITLLDIDGSKIEILATEGDLKLGGADIDNVIIEYIIEAIEEELDYDVDDDMELYAEITVEAERIKKGLSAKEKETIKLKVDGSNFKREYTKGQFEESIRGIVERTLTYINACLHEKGIKLEEVDKVLMVGGSTRVPLVGQLLEEHIGTPVSCELNPDEVVAQGAAILANIDSYEEVNSSDLTEKQKSIKEIEVVDVASHGLGMVFKNEESGERYNRVLLSKNEKLPAVVTKDTAPGSAGQRSIIIEVTQGDFEELDYVDIIGDSEILLPSNVGKGYGIQIKMSIDNNGCIAVDAYEKATMNHLGSFEIERQANLSEGEIVELVNSVELVEVQ